MYLVSVYFDDKSNRILKRHIDMIAERTGNRFMVDNHVPPHMTISSIEARSADILVPAFEKIGSRLESGKIQIVSVGQIFPYVFYATPVLNDYLQSVAQQVYDGFSGIPETEISRFYRPGSWLPHITLGKMLQKEQMLQAFDVMMGGFSPIDATVTEIGLAKTNPHEDVLRFRL